MERENRFAVTMKKLRWLTAFLNGSMGKQPIASISAQELLVVLWKIESKGRYETAKRLRGTCSQIFRYAIATARADRDVAADLRGALIAPQPVRRPAITDPKGVGGLLPMFENTINAALRRMGFAQDEIRARLSCNGGHTSQ